MFSIIAIDIACAFISQLNKIVVFSMNLEIVKKPIALFFKSVYLSYFWIVSEIYLTHWFLLETFIMDPNSRGKRILDLALQRNSNGMRYVLHCYNYNLWKSNNLPLLFNIIAYY